MLLNLVTKNTKPGHKSLKMVTNDTVSGHKFNLVTLGMDYDGVMDSLNKILPSASEESTEHQSNNTSKRPGELKYNK